MIRTLLDRLARWWLNRRTPKIETGPAHRTHLNMLHRSDGTGIEPDFQDDYKPVLTPVIPSQRPLEQVIGTRTVGPGLDDLKVPPDAPDNEHRILPETL